MKVGFIGVGNMGGPMCRNIVKRSNHQVTVFDLNAAALKTCTDLGFDCGPAGDGCGKTLDCGDTCPVQGDTCGGGGVATTCVRPEATGSNLIVGKEPSLCREPSSRRSLNSLKDVAVTKSAKKRIDTETKRLIKSRRLTNPRLPAGLSSIWRSQPRRRNKQRPRLVTQPLRGTWTNR